MFISGYRYCCLPETRIDMTVLIRKTSHAEAADMKGQMYPWLKASVSYVTLLSQGLKGHEWKLGSRRSLVQFGIGGSVGSVHVCVMISAYNVKVIIYYSRNSPLHLTPGCDPVFSLTIKHIKELHFWTSALSLSVLSGWEGHAHSHLSITCGHQPITGLCISREWTGPSYCRKVQCTQHKLKINKQINERNLTSDVSEDACVWPAFTGCWLMCDVVG